MNLKGKTIILTGVRRIGKEVAKELTQQGANLVVTFNPTPDQTQSKFEESLGTDIKALAIPTDLAQEKDIANLVEKTVATFGRIDGLVHLASPYPTTPIGKITMEEFSLISQTIAGSSLLLGQKVGLAMLENPGEEVLVENKVVGKIKGKMLFFSDWSVLNSPYPEVAVYNSAKAAVNSITLTLARHFAPSITVNAIAPGPILPPPDLTPEDNQESMQRTPLAHWGGAEEISKAVLYLLDADFVTGVILPVDGGRSIS